MIYFLIGDSMTLTLLVIITLAFIYYMYNFFTSDLIRRIGIPGPIPIPFSGELFNIIYKVMCKYDMDLIQKYERIVGVYEGSTPTILLSDLELLRKILIKDLHIFINRRSINIDFGPLSHGLTQLKDEQWKNARAIVSPTFSTAKLKGIIKEILGLSINIFTCWL